MKTEIGCFRQQQHFPFARPIDVPRNRRGPRRRREFPRGRLLGGGNVSASAGCLPRRRQGGRRSGGLSAPSRVSGACACGVSYAARLAAGAFRRDNGVGVSGYCASCCAVALVWNMHFPDVDVSALVVAWLWCWTLAHSKKTRFRSQSPSKFRELLRKGKEACCVVFCHHYGGSSTISIVVYSMIL